MITVVVPTIQGREDHYARCIAAYESRTSQSINLVTFHDYPACGLAWNDGAKQAYGVGDFLHFTADDLEPHDGWDIPAIEAVRRGYLPAPRIVNVDGTLDYCGEHGIEMPDKAIVQMSVIPFMTWEQWDKIGPGLDCHYFTDNYLSWRGLQAGYKTIVRRKYAFTHHWAQPGRGAGMTQNERMAHDLKIFQEATGGAMVSP